MKRLLKYFLEGLLFTVPVAVTVYIVYVLFEKIDGLLGVDNLPGVGFVTTIAVITLIGFLASNIFTKGILSIVDRILNRLPLVKLIYGSLKDLIGAFVGNKKSFSRPVVVSVGGAKVLGFITQDSVVQFGLIDHVAVYLPQSYNFAGNVLLFPKEQVTLINTDSSEVMTFIVSGGVSSKQ